MVYLFCTSHRWNFTCTRENLDWALVQCQNMAVCEHIWKHENCWSENLQIKSLTPRKLQRIWYILYYMKWIHDPCMQVIQAYTVVVLVLSVYCMFTACLLCVYMKLSNAWQHSPLYMAAAATAWSILHACMSFLSKKLSWSTARVISSDVYVVCVHCVRSCNFKVPCTQFQKKKLSCHIENVS